MNTIKTLINQYLGWIVLPKLGITDVLEIMILAFLVYHIIIWVRDTRAWRLFKGISVLIVIWLVAALLQFNVIGMPIVQVNDKVSCGVMRCRRMIGNGDKIIKENE